MQYENGIYCDMSNDDYHNTRAISRSALMKFQKTPYHYWYEYINPDFVKPEPTPAQIMGHLVHLLILEPEKVNKEFAIVPEHINRRTNAGKEEYAAFLAENTDKTVIKKDILDDAKEKVSFISGNDILCKLLEASHIETSIFFTHKETGLQCKARPDIFAKSLIGDLKTTSDIGYRAFQGSCIKYGYFLQAGMIKQALASIDIKLEKYICVCLEKTEPYLPAFYEIDAGAIEWGELKFDALMRKLHECYENDAWPGYNYQEILLPNWVEYDETEASL